MTDEESILLKEKVRRAFDDEEAFCTAAYIAEKIGEPQNEVFYALSELEDDDEIALQYAPCYFKYGRDFETPETEPIKDARHKIDKKNGWYFWAPL